jgi:hypothetical protein
MAWEFLAVRRPGEPDARLWPTITADADGIEPDPGEQLQQFRATSLRAYEAAGVGQKPKLLQSFIHRSVLWLGPDRAAVSCVAYNRPRVFAGGAGLFAVVTLAIAGVTTLVARRARRGTLLVGQVRFPWVVSVGYRGQTLRLNVRTVDAGRPRLLILDVGLRKETDVPLLAKQIAIQVARVQLAATPEDRADVRTQLQQNAGDFVVPPPETKKVFAMYHFPHAWPVSPETADAAALPWSD